MGSYRLKATWTCAHIHAYTQPSTEHFKRPRGDHLFIASITLFIESKRSDYASQTTEGSSPADREEPRRNYY
ncbi:hypothetical protein RRG08_042681 [Elysia crispata]|uniref:Uncharacterized protein n=1 Tax=Elysia crispata TaxID=231223 RepID=A0AAE0XQY3_9GAST|nr:hypothetical protein RRG08_042681 [Elysia crispata]